VRPLTLSDLNRALLARQLLLERRRLPVPRAIERLAALQAQMPFSPYIALWSRLDGFRAETLSRALERGTVLKGWVPRGTLHLLSREDYPAFSSSYVESQRGRAERLGADLPGLARELDRGPTRPREVERRTAEALGTDDRWTVAFVLRALPWIRVQQPGTWPRQTGGESLLWPESLPPPAEATAQVVRRALAAFGPMTRQDLAHFTTLPLRQLDPALEGMRRLEDDEGRRLLDVPRGMLPAEASPPPVRFLPSFDSAILAHRDRRRIIPAEYHAAVIRDVNATTMQTFLVDGFVAGGWTVERANTSATLVVAPFAPLPRAVRHELREEAGRLVRFVAADAPVHAVRGC
jgi:hypothetical protein